MVGDASNRQAAESAGFRTVAAGFEAALGDRSIDAVCIAAPISQRARMVAEACRAGKDVWVEPPVCASLDEGRRMVEAARRHRRVVQAGTVWRSSRPFQDARRAVRSGDLGEIVFCRAFAASPLHLMDLLQFTFDEAVPASVAVQGSRGNLLAVFRYPGFVASYERRGTADPAIAFHGSTATLLVDPRDDTARAAHWRNFGESIGSRRRPVSDIETAVRSTAATWRLNL